MDNKTQQLTLNFLHWFGSLWQGPRREKISQQVISQYFAENICFYLNGNLLAQGLPAYCARLNALYQSTRHLQIKFPVENLMIAGKQAAVNYLETLVAQDDSMQVIVNGMFLHFDENDKITKLYDVFHGADPVK